ncbi:hypothetical protein DMENIID0001_061820 [Sergentomyia squamirostris]
MKHKFETVLIVALPEEVFLYCMPRDGQRVRCMRYELPSLREAFIVQISTHHTHQAPATIGAVQGSRPKSAE